MANSPLVRRSRVIPPEVGSVPRADAPPSYKPIAVGRAEKCSHFIAAVADTPRAVQTFPFTLTFCTKMLGATD
jgi:hypothetical protein